MDVKISDLVKKSKIQKKNIITTQKSSLQNAMCFGVIINLVFHIIFYMYVCIHKIFIRAIN